jgi:hypothetical protein
MSNPYAIFELAIDLFIIILHIFLIPFLLLYKIHKSASFKLSNSRKNGKPLVPDVKPLAAGDAAIYGPVYDLLLKCRQLMWIGRHPNLLLPQPPPFPSRTFVLCAVSTVPPSKCNSTCECPMSAFRSMIFPKSMDVLASLPQQYCQQKQTLVVGIFFRIFPNNGIGIIANI